MTQPTSPRLRGVAIPAEHGGWGLTLEPVVLGLVVAPSVAGVALGIAALASFLVRTPFKILAGDLRRGRRLARTALALQASAVYGSILGAAAVVAVMAAGHPFWPPLAAAVPLVVLQVVYDAFSRSRRLVPEIAGPVGIGSVAAAIALVGGEPMEPALGLWLVMALRSIASVILVRAQLRRARQQTYHRGAVHAVGVIAGAIAGGAAIFGVIPWMGAAAIVLLAPFGWWSLWRPAVRAVVVGIQQTLLGAIVVLLTATGVLSGI